MIMKVIRKYISTFRYNAWVLEGAEKHSGANLRMLFVGSHEQNKNYIARLVYKASFHEIFLGRFWMFRPLEFKHKLSTNSDLVITELKKRYVDDNEKLSFFVPCWVDGKINIDETLWLIEMGDTIKSDMRRIRKFKYTYEAFHEKEKFVEFYNNMYVPYTKNIYGNEALYHSLEGILRRFDSSEVLMIKDGQKSVAGGVIIYEKNGPKFLCIGVLNGDRQYVQSGAISALYYFRLLYLKDKGYREIDLGASRGFFSDGVLKYKRKWGMLLTRLRGSGFLIHQVKLKTSTKAFLINNPFVISEADGLSSVIFYDANVSTTEKHQTRKINLFATKEFKKLVICILDSDCKMINLNYNPPVPIEVRHIENQCASEKLK